MQNSSNDQYEPIPTRPVSKIQEDLTGIKFGKFRAIGPSKYKKKRWVVKCDCGVYTLRKSSAIKNTSNGWDRCGSCRVLLSAKIAEKPRKTDNEWRDEWQFT